MDVFDSIHPAPAAWLRASVLAPFVPTYWCRLTERRYALITARAYLCALAHFARWSRRRQLELGDLDRDIDRFVDEHLPRCTCPYPVQRSRHQIRAALQHLKTVLADAGVQSDQRPVDPTAEALCRFDKHMQQARGLAESARVRRLSVIRSLTCQTVAALPTTDELRHFMAQDISRVSSASASSLTAALRGYPR